MRNTKLSQYFKGIDNVFRLLSDRNLNVYSVFLLLIKSILYLIVTIYFFLEFITDLLKRKIKI